MASTQTEKLNWPVAIVVIIGTFMAILDGTIVNVALPRMMTVLNAAPDRAQWIVTSYLLCLGVIVPISGYLGDRFGYKRMYSLALFMFVLGSACCCLSWNVESMVVSRVIQAMGGGLMQPLGMAILYKNFPRERIGTVMGVWGIAIMAAPAVGPTLGGYLVDYASWRLIFFINIPLGILNLFLASLILKETELALGQKFDLPGMITSSLGFFCLLLAISQSGDKGWGSFYVLTLLYIAVLSLGILVYHELRHPDPILNLRLFKNFIFAISVVISSIISIGMYGALFLMPLFIQRVLGQSAMQTGLIMFPAALSSGLMMPISGRIFDRYGARASVILGLAIVAFTTYKLGSFTAHTAFWVMTFWLVMRGFGMGFCFMSATTAGLNTVPEPLVGRATALNNVIRQVSSAFGIAMFTTIMQNRQAFHYFNYAQSLNPASFEYQHFLQGLNGMSELLGMGASGPVVLSQSFVGAQLAKVSMIQAIDDCYVVAAALCTVALLLSFFLRDRPKASGAKKQPELSLNEPLVAGDGSN